MGKSGPIQGLIGVWLPFARPVLPRFIDEFEIGLSVESQVSELRDIGLSRFDGERFLDHGGVDEVGHGGVEANPLWIAEVVGVIHHHDSAFLTIDRAVHRHPARAGVVSVLAGFPLGGEHASLGVSIAVLLHPLTVSPDGHSAVMILLDEQGILGGAGLGGNEVELVVGHRFAGDVDPPGLFEDRFVGILARGEDLFEEKGARFIPPFLSQVTVKAYVAQLFGLVPKLGGFTPETRFGPGKEETVLMGVVGGIVTGHDLAGRGKERMYISVSGVMRSMFCGLGRGFGQVAQEGFPPLA